jgi:hypothetical protein
MLPRPERVGKSTTMPAAFQRFPIADHDHQARR